MNILGNLKPAQGAHKKPKRVGRGEGSGHGGTSTRGYNGQKSRAGFHRKLGFEGGQMPLQRRVPKFGFTNIFHTDYQEVNVEKLSKLVKDGKVKDGIINPEVLYTLKAIAKKKGLVKILGEGELKTKLKVTAHKFSKSAKDKIESAGGTIEVL